MRRPAAAGRASSSPYSPFPPPPAGASATSAMSSRSRRGSPPPAAARRGTGGVGEPVTSWLAAAGVGVLQLLPLNEMAPGQQSPYSAISAMAIDPIFIRVPDVAEFAVLGGEAALSPEDREALRDVRQSPRIRHHD